MKKSKSHGRVKKSAKSSKPAGEAASTAAATDELIVIDEKKGLIFENEEKLGAYFQGPIDSLEQLYQDHRTDDDFSDKEQLSLEGFLERTLDQPDEVWELDDSGYEFPFHTFITDHGDFHYVAVAYLSTEDNEPTFVLFHFPTKVASTLEAFRLGQLAYDFRLERVKAAVLEGDALGDHDPLSVGLFLSMVKVRSEKDIPETEFQRCGELREETIENPDEIWKKADMDGNVFVFFIKEFPDYEIKDLTYIVVTQEDEESGVNALLFSFPTNDQTLVDRYRQGENLEADEVVQESSH